MVTEMIAYFLASNLTRFFHLQVVFCIMNALDGAVFADPDTNKSVRAFYPAHFVALSNQKLCCFVVMLVPTVNVADSGTELSSQLSYKPTRKGKSLHTQLYFNFSPRKTHVPVLFQVICAAYWYYLNL